MQGVGLCVGPGKGLGTALGAASTQGSMHLRWGAVWCLSPYAFSVCMLGAALMQEWGSTNLHAPQVGGMTLQFESAFHHTPHIIFVRHSFEVGGSLLSFKLWVSLKKCLLRCL